MALAFGRNAWSWLGACVVSPALVACVVDVSSLTSGHAAGGSAGDAAGSGGDIQLGGASPANVAGGGGASAGASASPAGTAGQTNVGGSSAGGGSTGAAGAAPVCVKHTEICNGLDDDCNGVIDDGCPSALAWTIQGDRPQLGDSTGGSLFGDQCDAGEVLTGLKTAFGQWLDQVRGVCSRMAITADTSKSPFSYKVELNGARELLPHPETTTSAMGELNCPTNQALVGLRVSEQPSDPTLAASSIVLPRIWISCAALTLKGQPGSYTVDWQAPIEFGPLSGAVANDTAWFAKDATPAPQVPVRLTGSSGLWVDRVGLATGSLQVVLH